MNLLPAELQPEDIKKQDFQFDEERDAFIRASQRRALGPSTASLVRAAADRDIPFLRLNRYSLVQLGHGKYARRIQATVTSETRHIAVDIASDKEETNKLLGDLGLPVAHQRMVYSEREAARAAERIGFPVVVKPLNANHGRGVSIGLKDVDSVRTAFAHAREHSRTVLVESFISGLDHRLLVVNGELIAASKRVPGHVVGDGERTVEALLEEVNSDPRRGIGHEKVLTKLEFDHQALRLLEDLGYTQKSVPKKDEVVYLRSTGNLSTGGTAVDVTDIVHPDNREMAVRAAKAIGLDVAGVDFLTTDISESFNLTGGAICEINAAPGFRMHVAPSEGTPRDAAGPVLDMLFPPGSPSRIPIASVTGTNGKTTTVRMIAHIQKMAGRHVGLATTDAVYIDGHKTVEGDMTGPQAARMILRDPSVDMAVLETARGGLLRRGMGYRYCNVGAVLNVQSDHLGLKGVDTLEDLAKVKRILIEVARDTAVLNADDELCLQMADYTNAEHLCYVTMNSQHPLVREHTPSGGQAFVLDGHDLSLRTGSESELILKDTQIPATLDGAARYNTANALAAAAIAVGLGLGLDAIREGLASFESSVESNPGRLNIFDLGGVKAIVDFAHNPHGFEAICELMTAMPATRRLVLLGQAGDRDEESIREMTRITWAAAPDLIVIKELTEHLRGRELGETPAMIEDELRRAGAPADRFLHRPSELDAVRFALEWARAGDVLMLFSHDNRNEVLELLGKMSSTGWAPGSPLPA
ncbi:UNVERIFIED_CONTAM: hypothetical protein GTU68_037129 [Idotea baltica]|nr:hypothetical protein [Idotea baltica]